MPSQLTSVRLDDELMDEVRLVAEADGISRAEVIRRGIAEHTGRRLADAEVRARLEQMFEARRRKLDEIQDRDVEIRTADSPMI